MQRAAPSLYSRELVELIFVQPYSRISNVVDAGIAKRQTASEYLKELRDIGVLEEIKVGREKVDDLGSADSGQCALQGSFGEHLNHRAAILVAGMDVGVDVRERRACVPRGGVDAAR